MATCSRGLRALKGRGCYTAPSTHSILRETAIDLQIGDISHTIQLAVAPAFLLTGVGTNLVVLTSRLGRIIDRTRGLEMRYPDASPVEHAAFEEQLHVLYQRSHLIHRAITCSTSSGLLVCLVIAALFIGAATDVSLNKTIATMFVLAMAALICAFLLFLREIFVATRTVTVRRPLRQKGKN